MFNIEWDDLLNKNNINIIDFRDKNKYIVCHVFNSINVDVFELKNNPYKYLNKDDIYYIYCDNGYKSKHIVSYLNSLGFNTVNINGGFYNYLFR